MEKATTTTKPREKPFICLGKIVRNPIYSRASQTPIAKTDDKSNHPDLFIAEKVYFRLWKSFRELFLTHAHIYNIIRVLSWKSRRGVRRLGVDDTWPVRFSEARGHATRQVSMWVGPLVSLEIVWSRLDRLEFSQKRLATPELGARRGEGTMEVKVWESHWEYRSPTEHFSDTHFICSIAIGLNKRLRTPPTYLCSVVFSF